MRKTITTAALGAALTSLLLAGCWDHDESPTSSSPIDGGFGDSTVVTPAPSAPQVPTPTTPPGATAGAGSYFADLSPETTEDQWCALLTNNTDSEQWATVATYHDPDRDISTQTLFRYTQKKLDAGEERVLCAPLPCENWQADAVDWRGLPPSQDPRFGSNLLLGRIGHRSCAPPPPPPPPPCNPQLEECEPPPSCELDFRRRKARCENAGGIYSFDREACEDGCFFPPPGCEDDISAFTSNGGECPPPEFSCATYSGNVCHATGTNQQQTLFFGNGIPPGHCKHLEFVHSPGQGPVDTLGTCPN